MAKVPALPSAEKTRTILEWVVWTAHIVSILAIVVRDGARTLAEQGLGWTLPPMTRTGPDVDAS